MFFFLFLEFDEESFWGLMIEFSFLICWEGSILISFKYFDEVINVWFMF